MKATLEISISINILLMLLQGTSSLIGPRPTDMILPTLVFATTVQGELNARDKAEGFVSAESLARIFTSMVSSLWLQIPGY